MSKSHDIRTAVESDIQQIQWVRRSVKENVLSDPGKVTDEDCRLMISDSGRGWVAEYDGKVVGFAIVDVTDANIWALFVHPEFEGQGIGKELHYTMLTWYFENYATPLWLSTDPQTRAEEFYTRQGWRKVGIMENAEVRFEISMEGWGLLMKSEK